MSDGAHLFIPFASAMDAGSVQALRTLALPNLERLLARLAPAARDAGDEASLSMPGERALARELGLPAEDGRIPWAAWRASQAGMPPDGHGWAQITPCHWRVGSGAVAMDPPAGLQLREEHSRALFASIRPYFEEDGIALEYHAPMLWLARGDIFRNLATASLDRVAGRSIDDWLPRTAEAAPLRRLQQEMQMLLYTHQVNEEREQAGLLPVNSFWASGTGVMPAAPVAAAPQGLHIVDALRDAAMLGDWPSWAAAWRALDARECAELLAALEAGKPVALTLCGERSAQKWSATGGGGLLRLLRRLRALVAREQAAMLLESL